MENNTNYEPVAYLPKEQAERFTEFLKFSEITDVQNEANDLNDSYAVSVLSSDFEKAKNLFHIFSENELETEDDSTDKSSSQGSIYGSSAEKYSDNLSSAITFFICGAIGLIILLLDDFNVIHLFHSSGAFFILTNIVLGGLFFIFIFIGLKSLKYSKEIKSQIAAENEKSQKLYDWLKENISEEMIEGSYDGNIPEEMKYFSRSSYLKAALAKEFADAEETVIDAVSDKYIEELFA